MVVIGCDIGGVVRNNVTGEPILNSRRAIRAVVKAGHQVVFISKCKENYAERSRQWLLENKLDEYPLHFCLDYAEKVPIGQLLGIQVMIDDKSQVLNHFPNDGSVLKLWFCGDSQKVSGMYKFTPEFFDTTRHVTSWEQIYSIIIHESR